MTRSPLRPEEHGQSGVIPVESLGGEEESCPTPSVESTSHRSEGEPLGRRTYRAGLDAIRPVDMCESIEAADGRQPSVDGRGARPRCSMAMAVELDVGSLGLPGRRGPRQRPIGRRSGGRSGRHRACARCTGRGMLPLPPELHRTRDPRWWPASVVESESSTDMALLLQLGEPANTGGSASDTEDIRVRQSTEAEPR